MLTQIVHGQGKPIGVAQEPTKLESPIAESSYDSAETCVSPKFVLAFNPDVQENIPYSKR